MVTIGYRFTGGTRLQPSQSKINVHLYFKIKSSTAVSNLNEIKYKSLTLCVSKTKIKCQGDLNNFWGKNFD